MKELERPFVIAHCGPLGYGGSIEIRFMSFATLQEVLAVEAAFADVQRRCAWREYRVDSINKTFNDNQRELLESLFSRTREVL